MKIIQTFSCKNPTLGYSLLIGRRKSPDEPTETMTTKNKAAQALRAIPSATRSEVSKTNGAKGGRPADPFKASLREAGIKWAWTANGLLKFYLRSGSPQRMRDGSFWNGTETVGEYSSWEQAKSCGSLASTISDRI